jgi:threonine/homoserine/homoserine lactone efflux protein
MVTALLVGLVVGFVLAIPPGPLAIACISQALAGQARESVALALSASAMDIGYALLAAFASSALVGALRGLVTDNAWYLLAFQGGVYRGAGCAWPALLPAHRGRRTSPAGRAEPHA